MDKIIEAVLLGGIQGITEFLPISSSAHLKVFPWLFNWSDISASFDIALHLGTLLALIIFFFKDGISLIKNGIARAVLFVSKNSNLKMDEDAKKNGNLFWFIIAVTIPAGILSLVLDKVSDLISGINEHAEIICIAIASIIMGIILFIADKKCKADKKYDNLTFKDTFLIGISQALAAAFPGVSRSGVTISTSRCLGYDRESSAKISFLLSIPIVAAAALVKFKDFDLTNPLPFFLGIFVSFVVGLIVIRQLMKYLKNGNYKVFAIYRVVFGIMIIAALIIKLNIK